MSSYPEYPSPSPTPMRFTDRLAAAQDLTRNLTRYRRSNPLVLGIPRGGIPMAAAIAAELQGEMDVSLVHKLRHPTEPEVAIGALDVSGTLLLPEQVQKLGVTEEALAVESQIQLGTLMQQRELYSHVRQPVELRGRVVIVVDDGAATGFTLLAALHAAREQEPSWLVAAVPVASPQALTMIEALADDTVCLQRPKAFTAVGQWYQDFSPVSDRETLGLLTGASVRRHRSSASA